MMVYAYVHGIKQFRENELSIQKSVFKRLRVEHCKRTSLPWNRFAPGEPRAPLPPCSVRGFDY